MKKNTAIIIAAIFALLLASCAKSTNDLVKKYDHVIVLGFDGMSPQGLKDAKTPNFDRLIAGGASSMHVRSVLPTSSGPNWSAMIMGAGPEQTGVTSNSWKSGSHTLPAVVKDEKSFFPTIFHVIKKQMPTAEIGAIYHWGGFKELFNHKDVSYNVSPASEVKTADVVADYIVKKKPDMLFVQFDHVDGAGHRYGHLTQGYYESIELADSLLGNILNAIEKAGIWDNTLIICSADHGGIGYGHGGETLEEMETPIIFHGKGIKKNHKIKVPVYMYDNPATVAYALGLKTPYAWIGRPVKDAFEGFNMEDEYLVKDYLKKPKFAHSEYLYKKAGGLFHEPVEVKIENPNGLGEIYYTLDGSTPGKNSPKYTAPFVLENNVVVKAIVLNQQDESFVNEAYYRFATSKKPQVNYTIYKSEKEMVKLPADFKSLNKIKTGKCWEIKSEELPIEFLGDQTVVVFNTKIDIEEDGKYVFYTRSDDGSKLFIDGKKVVDNDGDHGVLEERGGIELTKGKHQLSVHWFNGGGGFWIDTFFNKAGEAKQFLAL